MKKLALILLLIMASGMANEKIHFHFPPKKEVRSVPKRESRTNVEFSPLAPDEFKVPNKVQFWPTLRFNLKY